MEFYRLATSEDFLIANHNFLQALPSEVKQLIENDQWVQAVAKYRSITGKGIEEGKRLCRQYQAFYHAKRDFDSGNPVYTKY